LFDCVIFLAIKFIHSFIHVNRRIVAIYHTVRNDGELATVLNHKLEKKLQIKETVLVDSP